MNSYLNKQLNGAYPQATIDGIENSFKASDTLINYIYNIDIDSAAEVEIEAIGKLIGFPRPLIPNEYLTNNSLVFYSFDNFPQYSELHGVSSIYTTHEDTWVTPEGANMTDGLGNTYTFTIRDHIMDNPYGGRFSSILTNLVKLPLATYRLLLKKIAYIKWNGLSIISLDSLISMAGVNYVFSWDVNHDIVITFDDVPLTVYTYIFLRIFELFCTQPQVNIS
jgi:hypothetical protein